MMINVLYIISFALAIIGMSIYIIFTISEGKDERGQMIIARSSHISMMFLNLVYWFLIIVVSFLDVKVEWLSLSIIASLSLIMFIQRISTAFIKRNV